MFWQVLLSSLLLGGVYGVVTIGLALIYGVMGVVNFAHGAFAILGAYLTFYFWTVSGWNPYTFMVPVFVVIFGLGALLQWGYLRFLPAGSVLAKLFGLLGAAYIIENTLLVVATADYRSIPNAWLQTYWSVLGLKINTGQFVAFCVSLVVVGLVAVFLQHTMAGKAIRAVVDDREMAGAMGINPAAIDILAFGLGSGLAAAGGVVIASYYTFTPASGMLFTILAFIAVVLGGMGSMTGALLGGFVVALVQNLIIAYGTIELQMLGLFVVFILILVVRPQGILGAR